MSSMFLKKFLIAFSISCAFILAADEKPELLTMRPPAGMSKANLFYMKLSPNEKPKAVLVVCPGLAGNGDRYFSGNAWTDYAKKNNLGLIGLNFEGDYYNAQNGSGKILLDGIKTIYKSELPIFICGFSAGSIFTSHFVEWKPDRVIAWSAQGLGSWDPLKHSSTTPPGIVSCGTNDERINIAYKYFKEGRKQGRPWLWVSIKGGKHSESGVMDAFAREYFQKILDSGLKVQPAHSGVWINVNSGATVDAGEIKKDSSSTGWLPDESLIQNWSKLTNGK